MIRARNGEIHSPVLPGRFAVVCAGLLAVFAGSPAAADRHCSFARESAFYARELSAEAGQQAGEQCRAATARALKRLDQTRIELEICTCAVAEDRLRQWFGGDGGERPDCGARVRSINAVSKELLSLIETCF